MNNKIIYFDRNENNYGPAPRCFDILKNADLTKISFYSKVFTKGVKSILSERLAKEFNIDEKSVLLGYGAEDLLKQVVQCYMNESQKIMIPTYSWWYYKAMADEVNGQNVEYPLIEGEDSFYYDVKTMLELFEKEKPSVVLISSPNNPTGNSISKENLFKVLEAFKDAVVVLDEAYWYDSSNEYVKGLIQKYPNLIVIRTFSKYYALAGMRIGFALVGENHKNLAKFTNRYLGFNRLNEEVAIAALDSADYYHDIANKMNEDRHLFYDELGKLQGFKVFKSNANFILVKIPKEMMSPLKEFLKAKNLIVKFMNEELLNSHLRISLGTQEQNKMVIEAIKEFCNSSL